MFALDSHVRPGEDRRGETDKCSERHQKHVEGVDEEQAVEHQQRAVRNHAYGQRDSGKKRGQTYDHIDRRRLVAVADRGQHQRAGDGKAEDNKDLDHSSSFKRSRCLRSRLSNCSRIWKKKTPSISMPTRTSRAMPSSTTIGMP